MGQCASMNKRVPSSTKLARKLKSLIDENSSHSLAVCLADQENLEEVRIRKDSHLFNLLGYSVIKGSHRSFQFLVSHFSVKELEIEFQSLKKTVIEYICEQGFLDLLKIYLPIYMRSTSLNDIKESAQLTAVQRACKNEQLEIIIFLFNYFQKKQCPTEFDVHYVEKESGNNCALLACQSGNLELIQYLYTETRANFHIINASGESAIQVAIQCNTENRTAVVPCVKYLVQKVKVNFIYMHEETLKMIRDPKLKRYFLRLLSFKGLSVSKSSSDNVYSFSKGYNNSKTRVPGTAKNLKVSLSSISNKNYRDVGIEPGLSKIINEDV